MNQREAAFEEVLRFWFGADARERSQRARRWFRSSRRFDRLVAERFGESVERAIGGGLRAWARGARGRLALIVLTDQFPRNVHRGTPAAFSGDATAQRLVREGLAHDHDRALETIERAFFYMPLMHAEDRDAQAQSVVLARANLEAAPGAARARARRFLDGALEHAEIIERFGRFPHRNRILGRADTEAERVYLAGGASNFGQR